MDDNLDDVVANIKATLNSSQNKITLEALNRDYTSVVGCGIPFRRLKFSSLEELIRAAPGLSLNRIGSQTFVEVKADAKTAHIAKLVREQKTAKKKSGRGRGPRRNFGGPPRNNYNRSASYRNPPPRLQNNNYSHRSYNSHDNRRKESENKTSSYSNASENRTNSYSNYRSTQPCTYNFSDDDDDYLDDFADLPSSEEEEEVAKAPEPIVTRPPEPIVTRPREPNLTTNFTNLHITVENKHFGGGITNTRLRGGLRMASKSYPHRTSSAEVDVGYSSMDGSSSDKSKVDKPLPPAPTTPERNITFPRTSPAQILAAGRAATQKVNVIQPDSKLLLPISRQPLHPSRQPQPSFHPSRIFETAMEASETAASHVPRGRGDIPFKPVNKLIGQPNPQFSMGAPSMMTKPSTSRTIEDRLFKSVPPSFPLTKTKPSKMIEDKMFKPGPDSAPSYADGTQCQELFAFAMKYKLGFPEFSNFHKYDADTNETLHMCKLKINGSTFPSEMYQHTSLNEVQEHAAEEALKELKKRYESGDSAVFGTATETQEIIRRITEIVSKHPTGLKSEFIEMKFREMYKEKLPRNWLEIIKTQSLLSVEKLVAGIFVYPPQDIGACALSTNKLPPLVLPEVDQWSVFVTMCVSTNYVYFRLVGEEYDAKYDAMAQAMEEKYNKAAETELTQADPIREGNYYAACLQGQWYRIKVLSSDLGNKYRVALVDHGETEEVLSECIFPLADEFTKLPAQAMRCTLKGLEQYHKNDYVTETVSLMTTGGHPLRAFIAEVNSRNPHLVLTLFDTTTEQDMNLNEMIKSQIEKELSDPKVPTESNFGDVYLTKVEEDGRAHVQIISDGLTSLLSLMSKVKRDMAKHAERYRLKSRGNLVGGKIVLAKYEGDQMWHRAEVVSLLNRDQMAEVRFIDYGNTEIVSIDHIAEMKYFSNSLSAIPPQAVEVQLVKTTSELFTQSVIEFLMSLSQYCDEEGTSPRKFLMKVIKSSEHVPVVELFLRDDKNEIVKLNDIIGSYYSDYRSANFRDVKPHLDLSKSFSLIPKYILPEPGAHLNVKVSMIINPSYFVVQPLELVDEFQQLTDEMTRYYSREKPVVEIGSIRVGNSFAVQNEEKQWCRGLVISVAKDSNEVSLYCVDYGNTVHVDFKTVYLLMPNFRKLPALAIKAELAGIIPVLNTWNMHDCLRFHELLQTKKEYVSVIVEASEDIVSVLLWDTSGDVDVNVGAILVEEGRAIDLTE